ncbi:MAG TPA: hypothetical protein VN456_12200 [Desulfosporosinus sp.]|nr:hypothetical protein [Desulfosporosinus sp.]
MDEKLGEIISALDTATGMLIVMSMRDQTVRKAMELVSQASFDLGYLIGTIEDLQKIEKHKMASKEAAEILGDMADVANARGMAYLYRRDTEKILRVVKTLVSEGR